MAAVSFVPFFGVTVGEETDDPSCAEGSLAMGLPCSSNKGVLAFCDEGKREAVPAVGPRVTPSPLPENGS